MTDKPKLPKLRNNSISNNLHTQKKDYATVLRYLQTHYSTYTIGYSICEKINPANCSSAAITVRVLAAVIDAVNDGRTDDGSGPWGKKINHPRQIEFARLNLTYTVMSKRKLLKMVEGGYVEGWDDPRMLTISGLRRRGYTPASIRNFCGLIGLGKRESWIDMGVLENAVRDDLN